MMIKIFVVLILMEEIHSYCPPLLAPNTTILECKDPTRQQRIHCSTSWLDQGTVARFKCLSTQQNSRKKVIRGRIVCMDDGKLVHIRKPGDNPNPTSNLPCGITKQVQNPDIHVYGYLPSVHYDLPSVNKTQDFRLFGEALHNELRSLHGSPPLKLDDDLSISAQKWADHIASRNVLDMAPGSEYGQNIYLAKTNELTSAVNDAILNWYKEGHSEYCWEDVSENWDNSLALDFSQLVWINSKYFGIGAAAMSSKPNNTIVLALYSPTGNVVVDGDEAKSEAFFRANVKPLKMNKL